MIAGSLRRMLAARRQLVWETYLVAGGRMRVRRFTAGPHDAEAPTIVLLSGLGLSGHYMLPVGVELAPRFPVWIPDLPRYGRTLPGRVALDVPELADAVVAWMDRIGLDRAALVGNSMGCQTAVEAAARHPDRVSHVVLEGPTIDAGARSILRHAGRIALAGRREPASLGPLQVADWSRTGPRGVVATIQYAFSHRIEDRLPDVRCPALVVRGTRDPIVPQGWAEQVAAGLPHGSLVVVPGASHAMTYASPRELAELVETFVLGSPGGTLAADHETAEPDLGTASSA
jgi:2-hydroxy-6-oxonona-2,4-dienedioate hydrolase